MKILIVDDEAVAMTALVELLTMDGHSVDHASNGHGALAMLSVTNPDVIVMDWRMPMLDGHGLVVAVRSDTRFKKTPILVLTAMSREDMQTEMARIRGIGEPMRILQKPVSLQDVKAELHELSKMTV